MERQISCEFNIDTACVVVKYADGSILDTALGRENQFLFSWGIWGFRLCRQFVDNCVEFVCPYRRAALHPLAIRLKL